MMFTRGNQLGGNDEFERKNTYIQRIDVWSVGDVGIGARCCEKFAEEQFFLFFFLFIITESCIKRIDFPPSFSLRPLIKS